ncbi:MULTISPECIES: maleylpyruvate isomerase family mycothiol-dependent enzyme [Actinosynnema]|uniref:maleylpyruvate isomerase family mycothiol-dependent enzyme n=1 Tax=Actinosynnema TaxID=40566 RepID=UPI0020A257BB|nr:maleylpyruvate isomerase family mycothiol-dependent enzyme [Actinosynnema pretiosum]MCP2093940.1 TIGR03083 family protein [Actinosynnema pretiosum]
MTGVVAGGAAGTADGGAAAGPGGPPVGPLTGADVRGAAGECAAFLSGFADRDWAVPVPDLDWTVAQAVAHLVDCLRWYALDLAGGPEEMDCWVEATDATADPAMLVRVVRAQSEVLAATIDASPPGHRGWHPSGLPEAAGFAAMACDELLVHTWDAGRGLGAEFTPTGRQAAGTLARLFPQHEVGADAWRTLLWANGRVELPGRPAQAGWKWRGDPLT